MLRILILISAFFSMHVFAIAQTSYCQNEIIFPETQSEKQDGINTARDSNKLKFSYDVGVSYGGTLHESTYYKYLGDGGDYPFLGMTKHATNCLMVNIGSGVKLYNNLRLKLGLEYSTNNQQYTTDTALMNEYKIQFGYEPNPEFGKTQIFNITGNQISLNFGGEYYFHKHFWAGLSISRHSFVFPHVERVLYDGQNISEDLPLTRNPEIHDYIPFSFWRMSYDIIFGSQFPINASKSLMIRPSVFCSTRGFRFTYSPWITLFGCKVDFQFRPN